METNERASNCGYCGDPTWTGVEHECWVEAKLKTQKYVPLNCPRCGYETSTNGYCIRWMCGME